MFSLKNKVALITGASRGIGEEVAKLYAKAGAQVIVSSRRQEGVDAVAEKIRSNGGKATGIACHIGDQGAIEELIETIKKEFGQLDILVNNAAIIKRVPILEMKAEDFRQVIDIDLVGPFIMAKNVVKRMLARKAKGKVINMCSMMSEVSRNTVSAYAAAKGGLKMLTKEMADEWAKLGIQTNALGPGYFATDQTAPIRVDGHPFNEFIIKRTPARRWGNPDELQGAAIFLASKASDFVNGHILYVDGGILATLGSHAEED